MTLAAYVRLTPSEREALWRDLARLVMWVARWLHVPWWGGILIALGVTGSLAVVGQYWRDIAGWARRRLAR